jgi:prepilin-type N-terminal cleavage/methylation domain-containing protein
LPISDLMEPAMDRPTPKRTRTQLGAEDGMTLIEVLVSMLLVGLIALSFLGLDAAGRTTADQRRVSQATQVAQADQERLRGMSADQLATLNQPNRPVIVDGVTYQVSSTGKYQSASTSGDSCATSGAAADYAKVTSSVTWPGNKRGAVIEQSLITPRIGGSLLVQALDQGAAGIAGATVTATGTDSDNSGAVRTGTTDSGGCVIFGALPVGSYSVATSLAGYLDSSGSATPTSNVTTTSGSTTNLTVRLARPGKITVPVNGFVGVTGNAPSGIISRAPAFSWINSGMSTAGVLDPATDENNGPLSSPQTVFPYIVGTTTTNFTGNYVVYAGKCSSDLPPPGVNQSLATVPPAGTATSTTNGLVTVKMPVINLSVTYGGSTSQVRPDHVTLKDSCNDTWRPTIASTKPATGWLQYPGQPYSASYTVCVDYDPPSISARKGTATVANTSFTAADGNAVTVALTSGSTGGVC